MLTPPFEVSVVCFVAGEPGAILDLGILVAKGEKKLLRGETGRRRMQDGPGRRRFSMHKLEGRKERRRKQQHANAIPKRETRL